MRDIDVKGGGELFWADVDLRREAKDRATTTLAALSPAVSGKRARRI
jgi:hypothetical protein